MSFTADLFDGLATALSGAGLGLTYRGDGTAYQANETAIFDEQMPAAPDRVVVLTFYSLSDDSTLSDSETGLQVRTRGAPNDAGDAKALDDAIFDYLQNATLDLAHGIRLSAVFRASGTPMGVDVSQRSERSSNYRLLAHRPSLHRT